MSRRFKQLSWIFVFCIGSFGYSSVGLSGTEVSIGSKAFTEGMILSEIAAQLLEQKPDITVQRHFGMGGTGILFEALQKGEIQFYPEYTGTIAEAILKNPAIKNQRHLDLALGEIGLTISQPLGFNNTYALGVTREIATKYDLKKISDLRGNESKVKLGFSHEFMTRADGFRALSQAYLLGEFPKLKSLEHALAFEAIAKREIDVMDIYSTDAKISKLDLVILEDDINFFPKYEAVFLARLDFVNQHPDLWEKLRSIEGKLSASLMIHLNGEVDIGKKDRAEVVANYFGNGKSQKEIDNPMIRLKRRTLEHLYLVFVSLFFSVIVGVPLGILSYQRSHWGQAILITSGVFQTIPSLALFCFLIPFFGIGEVPALIALSLYGLLPVVINTVVGLRSIDDEYYEMSRALGLSFFEELRLIQIPLASRAILAGIKTSLITGIGTATLAALIGAGGYGVPIVTGLAINDMKTILFGAIPAAVMAILAHLVFILIEKKLVPKGA